MGLDGGTYITRSDVLRGQSWAYSQADNTRSTRGGSASASTTYRPKQLDRHAERHTKWSTCALSGQPLATPIAADWLGRLFNYEAVIAFLLGRSGLFEDDAAANLYANQLRTAGTQFDNLQTKRDVFTIQLAERPEHDAANGSSAGSGSRFECPVTQLPCESAPFSALPACGHVLSDRVIRERIAVLLGWAIQTVSLNWPIKSTFTQVAEGICPICSAFFQADAAVPINGTAEQVEKLRELLPSRQKRHSKDKGRKRKADAAPPAAAAEVPSKARQAASTTQPFPGPGDNTLVL